MGRDPSKLHPELQVILAEFKKRCKAVGLNVLITQTFRSTAEQNALYAQGRTKPGKIVTNCKGDSYQSPHQWGCAFDFCENVKGKEYADNSFFKKCGDIGKSLGLFWGGNFKSFVDTPHLEYPKFIVSNSTATLKSKYGTPEKFIATWGKPGSGAGSSTSSKNQTTKRKLTNDLQAALNTQGFKLVVDGIFGEKTKAACDASPLKNGSIGTRVQILQEALILAACPLTVDGKFGHKTLTAVKTFQIAKGITVDGIVVGGTWAKLLT